MRQLDPLALVSLKLTGGCELAIPEWLYDLDCPGLYMRRIKTVALSLPAVVGPYTTINCTLTLLRSTVRKKPELKNGKYARDLSGDDDRFVDYVGGAQSIVTSGGTHDAGMFEHNLHNEWVFPFEGAGAVSAWRLELPKDFPPFDYATISDAILHVQYTARQGVDGKLVTNELATTQLQNGEASLGLLFSLRHDFPTEWSAFVNTKANTFSAILKKEYFPYFAQGKSVSIDAVELYTGAGGPTIPSVTLDDLTKSLLVSGTATLTLDKVPNDAAAQVFLVVRYSLS